MKTWEMIKELTEHPDKKFKERILGQVEIFEGDLVWSSDMDFVIMSKAILATNWEEIKEPVSFMEVVKSEKYFTVTHELIQHKHDFENMDLRDFAAELTNAFHPYQIKKILLEGKFYIED